MEGFHKNENEREKMRSRPPITSMNLINKQLQAQVPPPNRTQSEPISNNINNAKPNDVKKKKVLLPPPTVPNTLPNTFINKVNYFMDNVEDEKDTLSDDSWDAEDPDLTSSSTSVVSAPITIPSPQKLISPKGNSVFVTTVQKTEAVEDNYVPDDGIFHFEL